MRARTSTPRPGVTMRSAGHLLVLCSRMMTAGPLECDEKQRQATPWAKLLQWRIEAPLSGRSLASTEIVFGAESSLSPRPRVSDRMLRGKLEAEAMKAASSPGVDVDQSCYVGPARRNM